MILLPMTQHRGYSLTLVALLLGNLSAAAQQPEISSRLSSRNTLTPPAAKGVREEWFRIEFDDKLVGHESLNTLPLSKSGSARQPESAEDMVRRIRDTRLQLRRFGTDLSVSAHLETVESIDGVLYSWSLRRTDAEGSVLERTGTWNAAKSGFEVSETVAGSTRRQLITSPVQPRSPIFPAWLEVASKDRSRLWTAAVFFPETAAIVDIEIHRTGSQSLKLGSSKTLAVTRIDYWPSNSPDMKSAVFYDEQLTAVRCDQMLAGETLRIERSDAANALGKESLSSLDLQFSSVVPLKRQLTNLDRLESLKLLITVGDSEQITLPSTDFQTVEQSVGNSLVITLTRPVMVTATSSQPITSSRKSLVDPSYLASTRWLTSDNEEVKRMAIIAGGSTSIPADKCQRLTLYVWKHLRVSPFSTALQPVPDIIRHMRGDCTEHAVLLSTLMRAQGIPSRVVVGFVYVPNPASFAPHMWTEAFVDNKWIPFDSTRGTHGIGLTHIKVADSSLSDDVGSGTVLFVPLLSFLGRASVDLAPM